MSRNCTKILKLHWQKIYGSCTQGAHCLVDINTAKEYVIE